MSSYDAIVIGGSLSGAAAAKRLVDAGLRTLVIERMELPRHKPCSGIISPRGHRFLLENFGPLPAEALHHPATCQGVVFHYPSRTAIAMDFFGGTTPHLNRTYSDHWALISSGAEIMDDTRFTGLRDMGTHIEVSIRRDKADSILKARYVIGADGPNSSVVRALYPGYRHKIHWFTVKQHFHRIIENPLDRRYFHFWVNPELGFYTWSHERNGGQIVGVGYEAGDNLTLRHERVLKYLEENHGLRVAPTDDREASVNNFGLSLTNRYVFGRGNVLVTGQAAGFLNMIAEGMSCALHAGAIAGEAVIESTRRDTSVQSIYRTMIGSEVRRTSDQWNIFKILFNNPHEADFMGALKKLPMSKRINVFKESAAFLWPWGRYNWGRIMLREALRRQITGAYNPSNWL